MQIVRKKLTPDEITPPGTRYNSDCNCFQTTFDDGATWVDNPAADPRSAPQYQAPAPTGGDPQCDGAARMTALLRDSNDVAIHAVSVAQAYSSLFALIAIIFSLGVGLLVSLLIALADLIFSVGTTVVDDAFTTEVYDQILCITYNHLNVNGQFDDAAAWDAYQDEIGATFGISVVTAVLARMFLSFGFVTMNNAASLRTETGDCDACNPVICDQAFGEFGQDDWEPEYPGESTGQYYADGVMHGTFNSSGHFQVSAHKTVDFDVASVRLRYSAHVTPVNSSSFGIYVGGVNQYHLESAFDNDVDDVELFLDFSSAPIPAGTPWVVNCDQAYSFGGAMTGSFDLLYLEICPVE